MNYRIVRYKSQEFSTLPPPLPLPLPPAVGPSCGTTPLKISHAAKNWIRHKQSQNNIRVLINLRQHYLGVSGTTPCRALQNSDRLVSILPDSLFVFNI